MILASRIIRSTGIPSRVAGAAEELDRVGGHPHRGVAGEELAHRRGLRDARVSGVEERARLVDEQPRRLDLGRHVGEHELHALEVGDPLPELAPFGDVARGRVERALRDAERLHADDAAATSRAHPSRT